jgi:hypothetical protein
MLEYLEKFNNLPDEVKKNISSAAVMAAIEELEEKYGVDLATFIMRVMVGELYYKNITANLIIEYSLAPEVATTLAKELQDKVFALVMDYLDGGKLTVAAQTIKPAAPFLSAPVPLKTASAVISPASATAVEKPKQISPFSSQAEPVKNPAPVAVLAAPIVLSVKRAPAVEPIDFLEEDKKDIAEMKNIASSLRSAPQEKNDKILLDIIKEANISFASEALQNRFRDLLISYLRSIRTKVQIRESLIKDISLGGLKMSEEEADRILLIAQNKLPSNQEQPISLAKVSAKTTSSGTNFVFNKDAASVPKVGNIPNKTIDFGAVGARDTDYDLSALKNRPAISPVPAKPAEPVVSKTDNLPKAPFKIIPSITPKPVNKPIQQDNTASPEKLVAQDVASLRTDESSQTSVAGNKQRMDDIKPAPRIMSPIDELAYMDLVNFRRLDPVPLKRVAKIEEKIALLEKEGIDKKIEGIRVWRLNPVSKTYLAMGQESIGSTKTIDDIIKERKDQGLNYLTKEEFEAVMDLNNNLRF